jgi:tetratricopeptide (TPR) repeat protein
LASIGLDWEDTSPLLISPATRPAGFDAARDEPIELSESMRWIERGRSLAEQGRHAQADLAFARAASSDPDDLNRFIKGGVWVVGPYPEDLALACPPEYDPDPSRPVDAVGGDGKLSWRRAPTSGDGRVNLNSIFKADHIAVYALSYVTSPDERVTSLLVGGDDLVRVWVNGRVVHETTHWWDDSQNLDRVSVTLRAGRNTILAKINNVGGAHHLILRLDNSPTDRLDDLPARFDLADASLRAGRMDEATGAGRVLIPLLRRAVEQRPDDPSLRHRFALALVLAGDREGYRRACAATLDRLGRSEDPMIGEAVRACLVGPDSVDDFSVARRLVERGLAREPGAPWLYYLLGLADLRAGRSEEEVEHLEKSRELGNTWAGTPLNYPALAMAHHRLGHRDEARRWLGKAHGRRADPAHGVEAAEAL